MTNKEIANQFSVLAKLMDIHGENSFKAKAHTNAAFAIGQLPHEIEETGIEAIEGQRGIGKGTIDGILQIMDDGELEALTELTARTPAGILELLKIRGIGPKKIGQLWRELAIETPGDLLQACEENRLVALKGFGAKTQTSFQEKIEFYFSNRGSLLWSQAEQLLLPITDLFQVRNKDAKIALVGDFYWQNETVSSFDFVIGLKTFKSLPADNWLIQSQVENVYSYKIREHLNIKLIVVPDEDFDRAKFVHSFSKEIQSEMPVDKISNFANEETAFKEMGLQFMRNCLRNNFIAFEKAKAHGIPQIIVPEDVKGVIHNHTNWSDGANSILEMAEACIERGYEYFVLSDHSKTSFYANGLSVERIYKQHQEIDEVNQRLKPFRVFKSIECDILSDGSLDYDNEVLSSFDIVIVSVHQNLSMTEEKAMNRLINAIENPFTSILGHATGRLLLSREGYPIDHKKIIDACAANEVAIEINANPRRLDMDWRWIDYAMQKDVLLSINPDAHRIEGIDDIRYGVQVAQKGMLPAAMNLSSFSLDEFEDFLMQQHQKRY